VEKEVGFLSYFKRHDHAFSVEEAKIDLSSPFRLDSFFYSGYCAEALRTLDKYPGKVVRAKDVGYRIYNPPLFKRQFAESGHPYMSGVDFYNLRPTTDRFLSKNQQDVDLYLVRKGMVLVQSAGQRYGLITTPLMVTRVLDGVAITSDVVRIDHNDPVENGYICGLLGSGFGRRLALRYSYGTSIPRLDVPEFTNIRIPWPEDEVRRNIGQIVVDAYQQFDLANEMEDQAQELLAIAMSS
jgi:type I restriction enzyme S subunit